MSAPPRISRRRAAAVEDIDPFAVLGLDASALAVLDTAARAKEVRRAYRKAALDSHPDTSALDRADRFSLVQRAADLLRQDDVLDRLVAGGAAGARKAQDDKLSRLWRDEVREWSVERLSEHLRSKGLCDDVVAAFAEEEVDGREVVGLEMWGGAFAALLDLRGAALDGARVRAAACLAAELAGLADDVAQSSSGT